MIRRLRIEGWRAFEHLDLKLGEGTTFIVAENGIGKTSLIQAASWGLYGELSGIDPTPALRFGSGPIVIEVDLELPDGKTLNIERSFANGKQTLQARLDDDSLESTRLADVMAAAFGASPEFLSRTTVLASAAVADHSAGVFQLHEHLCRAFGVDVLQRAATHLDRIHTAAAKEAAKQRQLVRRSTSDIDRLRGQIAESEEVVSRAEQARTASREAVDAAQRKLDRARATQAARQRADATRAKVREIWTAADPFLTSGPSAVATLGAGPDRTDLADLRRLLSDAETDAIGVGDDVRTDLAVVDAELSAVRAGIAGLHEAGAECPVCRRDLLPQDRAQAEEKHHRTLEKLTARRAGLQTRLDTAARRVQGVRSLISRAAAVPDPEPPESTTVHLDLAGAIQEFEQARAVDDSRVNSAAEARANHTHLVLLLRDEETAAAQERQTHLAHRREAVANIGAQVMKAAAETILSERIDPLVTEITHRWKRVFVNRGELRLRHDGRLVLIRSGHEVEFDQLSSGERVIALLATRLLVLNSSTRASFLWLDEPLEHLDPGNRRLAASLMATTGGHTRQLLVTTYEQRLARQLGSIGSAEVRYIRTSD